MPRYGKGGVVPGFNQIMIVTEESVGEGSPLLFPKFSTCTGVVVALANTLVGGHFTQDLWPGEEPKPQTKKTLDRLVAQIAKRQVERLLIVGFNQNHNPAKLAQYLMIGPADREAYDISRKNVAELTVIVTHQGAGVRPQVEYKRQSKVAYTVTPNPNWTMADLHKGSPGDATTGKLHELRKHFVGVL